MQSTFLALVADQAGHPLDLDRLERVARERALVQSSKLRSIVPKRERA